MQERVPVPPNLSLTQSTLCWPGPARPMGTLPFEAQCGECWAVQLIQPGARATAMLACLHLPAALIVFSVLLSFLTFLSPSPEGTP